MISSINQTAEEVTIKASKINLSGYVTTSKLSAEIANLHETYASTFTTYRLEADYATLGYVSVQGHNMSPKTLNYTDANGNAASIVVLAK